MSTWTLKEVRALSEKHGGGNKCCAAKYLSHGDVEKYRPHPGDSLDKYKTFVRMAYEEKQFMAEPEKESDALQEEGEIAEKAEEEQRAEEAEEAEEFFDIPKKATKKAAPKKKVVEEEEDFDEEEEEEKPKKKVAKKPVKKAAEEEEDFDVEEEKPKKVVKKAAPKKKAAAPAPAAEDDFLGMSEPAPTATSTSALDDLNSMFAPAEPAPAPAPAKAAKTKAAKAAKAEVGDAISHPFPCAAWEYSCLSFNPSI
ncbi:hypothetical protein WA538_000693 [Blastocystis sp. DL]